MKLNIQSTKDTKVDGVKIVLYGSAGSGKTTTLATAPDPFIISAEGGLLSLRDKDVPFVEVRTMKEIDEAYKYVKSSEHSTICIDSVSEIGESVLNDYKKTVADGRQAYGKLADMMGAFIRNLRDLPGKHVVFVSKERRYDDEDSGITTYEPYIPGKVLPFNLPYLVDEVLCMRLDRKGKRYVQCQADRLRPCKDRSGTLDKEEAPDLSAIINKIKTQPIRNFNEEN